MDSKIWITLLVFILIYLIVRIMKSKGKYETRNNSTREKNDSKVAIEKYTENKESPVEKITSLTQEEIDSFVNQEIYERTVGGSFSNPNKLDDKIKEAAEIIIDNQQASASLLQRNLRLGYNRAGGIIDQLEAIGIIGPFRETLSREVLIENSEEINLLIKEYITASKSPQRIFFEANILPYKIDFIEKEVSNYYEKLYDDEIKKQLRQELLDKENERLLREKKEELRKVVIQELSEDGLITKDDYITKKREPISQQVQDKVWNRDNGRCVKCGSQENLEFDHIIPFSKGGSNTYRNLQLLCQKCNRKKSNKIG